MIVGVPKEIKTDEYRVAMLPVGAEELSAAGHKVLIEVGAGSGSGIADERYGLARLLGRRVGRTCMRAGYSAAPAPPPHATRERGCALHDAEGE